MSKRGSGEGTVFKRADGRWVGRISLGKDASGNRQRKTVYGKTQQEALQKVDNLRQQAKLNTKAIITPDSLAGYLQRWLDNDVAVNRAETTLAEYEGSTRLHTVPFIGHIKLSKLDGERMMAWQAELQKLGYSDNQRLRSIRVLRNALNKAVKLGLIQFNPCMVLDKPRVERKEIVPLEPEQCHTLFAECAAHRVGDIITLAAMTGLRKRELFALEWTAINLDEGFLSVRQALREVVGKIKVKPTKTKNSRRMVTLEPIAVAALRSRLEKAKAEGFDPEEVPIVFPDTIGGYLRGSNFDRQCWYPIRTAAGIPSTVKFHHLRHTQASLMLHAGVDLKVIQTRLGHADFSTTANTYAHLLQDAQAQASEKLGSLMAKTAPVGTFGGYTKKA